MSMYYVLPLLKPLKKSGASMYDILYFNITNFVFFPQSVLMVLA
jgi:hypothetical protein